jgi:hypothetical protein
MIAMIELTEQQRQELITTDAPQLLDPATGKTYVLVQTEVYERLKGSWKGTETHGRDGGPIDGGGRPG